ncbi:unnamed protein product [Amaranthus hypochondriacus]
MVLLNKLRNAVKKLTFLLKLKNFLACSTWQVASLIRTRTRIPATITVPYRGRRRALSFNDRPGLRACVEVVIIEDQNHDHDQDQDKYSPNSYDGDDEYVSHKSEGCSGATSPYPLRRTTSYPLEADVDKQSEMFIENFYKHLMFEKQVSLNLRYCRDFNSFNSSSDDYSVVSPLSSGGSQLVSPI